MEISGERQVVERRTIASAGLPVLHHQQEVLPRGKSPLYASVQRQLEDAVVQLGKPCVLQRVALAPKPVVDREDGEPRAVQRF